MNWGQALTKALAGNPDALNVTSYSGDVDKHPIGLPKYFDSWAIRVKQVKTSEINS